MNFAVGSEGPEREWKERLPPRGRIAHTLCAFANGAGGTLLVGVRDNSEIAGLANPEDVQAELERLALLLDPPQTITARVRHVEGCAVLEVSVSASATTVSVRGANGELDVYVRDGSSSRRASKDEALALCRVTGARTRIDATARRLMEEISKAKAPTMASIAKAARLGARTARRHLIPLIQAGLVLENQSRGLWLTPHGHKRLRRDQ